MDEVDTPALLLDAGALERNISRMAKYFEAREARLRPHVKTHKCPVIARMQVEAGARGITCAKIGEAEVMADAGLEDILIANEVVGPQKIERLMDLAARSKVTVAVDDPSNVEAVSQAASKRGLVLSVLVEVNVGLDRCGVEPGRPALALARKVVESPGLRFRGLMGYEGHVQIIPDFEKRREECLKAMKLLLDTEELLEAWGLDVEVVSAGGTGTYNITGDYPGVTEVQAGSYATMDAVYRDVGVGFECALTILATVVSRPSRDRAVIDVGMKAASVDHGLPQPKDLQGATVKALHEEHGILGLENPSRGIRVGDKLELIPAHGCTTVNLHDRFHAMRNGKVEAVWDIAARGRFR